MFSLYQYTRSLPQTPSFVAHRRSSPRKKKTLLCLSLCLSSTTKKQGVGSRLIDESGVSYLDTRNNVAHCGHCHPRIVQAIQAQVAQLNTNTRYLHPNLVLLGQRILAKFPQRLCKIFFCNSGSEANDMALRLAKAYSGGSLNTIVVQGAYHGHTMAVLDISPYKYLKGTEYDLVTQPPLMDGSSSSSSDNNKDKKGNNTHKTPGRHIWQVPAPDVFRGPHRNPETAGTDYADYVREACRHYTETRKENVRAFIMEGGLSIGGVIVPPKGYLEQCAAAVRTAGGVYIADEVQTGFGRFGSSFWAFEHQSSPSLGATTATTTIPDIVTMGKPIGNGMPLAAVVCTEVVAKAFGWFNDKDIVMNAVNACQNMILLSQNGTNQVRFSRGRFQCLQILNQFDTQKQTRTTNLANQGYDIGFGQAFKFLSHI